MGPFAKAALAIGMFVAALLIADPRASRSAAQQAITATPTPRVVRIGRPRGTPTAAATPRAAATATPTPWLEIEADDDALTPTPWLEIEDETPSASLPTAVPTATPLLPSPTSLPSPTPTPTPTPLPPTATATVTPIPVQPTIAPVGSGAAPTVAPIPATRIDFAADDWSGGFFRGDSMAYGRPWVAVYGAFSDYPRASLQFTLGARPRGEATLTIVGLDDELAAQNQFALEINGDVVYMGTSPFPNWDGIGDGRDAAWTPIAFRIPSGLLRAGENEIAVANLTPAAEFNAPPYILLSEARLDFPGR